MIKSSDRITFYCFYNRHGIADTYVLYFLKGLKEVSDRIVVIINGEILDDSLNKIKLITSEIIIRDNKGFDGWAYKTGLKYVGWDKLAEYKEIICCNSSVFGPLYPFSDMFRKMSRLKSLDFWGITAHSLWNTTEYNNPYGYIPEHIQQYFIVYRKKFIRTEDFQFYWENLPELHTYEETVGLFETVFTKYFSDLGYKWSTYVRIKPDSNRIKNLSVYEPYKAVVEYKCPIIKRKTFYLPPYLIPSDSFLDQLKALVAYLNDTGIYHTGMILESISHEFADVSSSKDEEYFPLMRSEICQE